MTKRNRILAWASALVLFMASGIQILAQNSGRSLGFVAGFDAEEEIVSLGTAIVLKGEDGTANVYSLDNVLSNDAAAYALVTAENAYNLELSGTVDEWNLLEWTAPDAHDDPAALFVASAVQDQSAELVYLNQDGETQMTDVTIRDVDMDGLLPTLSVEGLPAQEAIYPAVILDGDGSCLGIVLSSNRVWAPFVEEDTFYGTGHGRPDSGGSESGSPGGLGSGGSGGGGLKSLGLGDYWKYILIGAVLGIVIVAAVFVNRGKKKKAAPVSDSLPNPAPASSSIPNPVHVQDVPEVVPLMPDASVPKQEVFRLVAFGGYMNGRIYPIDSNEITFGRDASSTVRFPADAKGVSRVHCKLFWQNGTLMLMDCGSSYGTFTTEGKLQPMRPVPIKYGDVFYIGEKNNCFKIV